MTNFPHLFRGGPWFAGVANLVFVFLSVHSQTAPTESKAASSAAYIRPWIMLPPEVPPKIDGEAPTLKSRIDLVYSDEAGASQTLVSQATPFSAGSYVERSPRKTELRLMKIDGDSKVELARVSASLKRGTFLTVIASKDNSGYRLSVTDDTPRPPTAVSPDGTSPPPEKTIVFYNFLPGPPAEVGSQDPAFTRTVPFGPPVEMKGLPGKIFSILMPVQKRKKKQIVNYEVDLQANDSVSFIISQDIYGRTGASVMPNGKVE